MDRVEDFMTCFVKEMIGHDPFIKIIFLIDLPPVNMTRHAPLSPVIFNKYRVLYEQCILNMETCRQKNKQDIYIYGERLGVIILVAKFEVDG